MFIPQINPFDHPPAIYAPAFDEQHALVTARNLLAQRDAAKGDYKDAVLALGRLLADVRRTLPDVPGQRGTLTFSPAFLAFTEKVGLTRSTVTQYMSYARDPKRLEANRSRMRGNNTPKHRYRRQTLEQILAAIENGFTADDIRAAIRKELDAPK
jgi:hypothetical protein